jgi:AraC-like DNA-binding protein
VHLSEGAFSRFFRAHAGKTFPEFINELRVGRACRLLAESELSITEVAFACGFANLSNFNRQFLRLKQVTPRAFRRAAQQHTLPGAPSNEAAAKP